MIPFTIKSDFIKYVQNSALVAHCWTENASTLRSQRVWFNDGPSALRREGTILKIMLKSLLYVYKYNIDLKNTLRKNYFIVL